VSHSTEQTPRAQLTETPRSSWPLRTGAAVEHARALIHEHPAELRAQTLQWYIELLVYNLLVSRGPRVARSCSAAAQKRCSHGWSLRHLTPWLRRASRICVRLWTGVDLIRTGNNR
jgi:hypothetical protein